jgi:hypothetical protein
MAADQNKKGVRKMRKVSQQKNFLSGKVLSKRKTV